MVTALAQSKCTRCKAQVEHGDLRCAVCAFAVPHHVGGAGDVQQEALKVFRCKGCGAAMSWSAEKKAVACAFCGEATALEEITDPVEQTEQWVPFAVDSRAAREAMRVWLKNLGWFRPNDLATASTIDEIKAIWWPAWIFDAHAECTWTADSNAGAGRSAWAPHAGHTDVAFERILIGASRGLDDKEMTALASAYNLASAQSQREAAAASAPDNVLEETFDAQRSAARERVAKACGAIAAERMKQGHIPGSTFRKVNVSLVLSELHTRRVALPAWILAYRYSGKLFRVVIHGQNAQTVTGTAPRSLWKILALVGGILAALTIIAVIIALVNAPPSRPRATQPARPAATAPAARPATPAVAPARPAAPRPAAPVPARPTPTKPQPTRK
jgi:DNA-directed RNA polymerase subunit RPC12/RpoP